MYNPSAITAQGTFTSTGLQQILQLQPGVSYFYLKNRTQWGAANASAVVVQAEWFSGMNPGAAYTMTNTASANSLNAGVLTSGGFTYIDPTISVSYAPIALASPYFTQANPGVFTTASAHGFAVGDVITFSDLTGARQYAGIYYTVSAVGSATTFSVLLNTTSVPVATGGFVQKVGTPYDFIPTADMITGISLGTTTTLTLATTNTYAVGDYVRVNVPVSFGTSQLNGQLGQVTAVNNSATVNTITLNINSSGYTTFAFPTSASVPTSFAQVVPVGSVATTLAGAVTNTQYRGLILGSGVVGTSGDVIDWWMFNRDLTLSPGITY